MSQRMAVLLGSAFAIEPEIFRSTVDPVVDCSGDEDKTQQSWKNEVDINTVVRRFGVRGDLPMAAPTPDAFGDFTNAADFHTMATRVVEAQQMFAGLPAAVRDRFSNDPGKFLDYVHKSDNIKEAVELGILDRSALEAVSVAPVASTTVAEGSGSDGANSPSIS